MKMKQIFATALAAFTCMSFIACKEGSSNGGGNTNSGDYPTASGTLNDKSEHKVEGTLHIGWDNIKDVNRAFVANGKTE